MPGIVESLYWRNLRAVKARDRLAHTVFFAETIHASAGIDFLLLARIKRVARGANFDEEVLTKRRAPDYRLLAVWHCLTVVLRLGLTPYRALTF